MSTVIYHDCNSDDGGDWRLNTPSDLAACFVGGVTLDTSIKKCGAGSLKCEDTDARIVWRNTDGDSFFSPADSTTGALSLWYRQNGFVSYGHPVTYPIIGLYNSSACDNTTSRNELSLSWSNTVFKNMYIVIKDKNGVEKVGIQLDVTAGDLWDEYNWNHIELNWNGGAANSCLFLNGVLRWENPIVFDRDGSSYPCNLLRHRPIVGGTKIAWIDEVYVFDEVQHIADFTPPGCPTVFAMQNTFGFPFGVRGFTR